MCFSVLGCPFWGCRIVVVDFGFGLWGFGDAGPSVLRARVQAFRAQLNTNSCRDLSTRFIITSEMIILLV